MRSRHRRTSQAFVVTLLLATGIAGLGAADEADRLFLSIAPLDTTGPASVMAFDIGPDGLPVPVESYATGGLANNFAAPQDLALDGSERFLFATNNESSDVASFGVAADGTLSAALGSPFATGFLPVYLAAHPDRPYLYVNNGGQLGVYEIETDGALTEKQIVDGFAAREHQVEPGGRFLYAADVVSGVRGYEISSSGTLTELPGSPYGFDTSRPFLIELATTGPWVYVLDLDNGIATFESDADGELQLLGQILLADFATEIELTGDDHYLYVGFPFNPEIRGFEIGSDGLPSELTGSPFAAEYTVIDLIAPPGTSRLYEITRELSSILAFDIAGDGSLTPLGDPLTVAAAGVPGAGAYLRAGTLEVTSWTVCSSGCDFTSIQAAVETARSGDTLELGAETFFENVTVDKDLTIRGAGAKHTIVDGSAADTVLRVSTVTVALSGMTIRNGGSGPSSGLCSFSGVPCTTPADCPIGEACTGLGGSAGGGIANSGVLTVNDCEILNNNSSGSGVCSFSGVPCTISPDCPLVGERCVGVEDGGGIHNSVTGVLALENCTIRDNTAVDGGGVANSGVLTVNNSTISHNTAGRGGGIRSNLSADTRITNSTISGNIGDGISGIVWISNSTVAANTGRGLSCEGGVCSLSGARCDTTNDCPLPGEACIATGSRTVRSSIVANNLGGDCSPGSCVSSLGFNLSGDETCNFTQSGDMTSTDPLLEALADNGGPTLTHALRPDSPAIDRVFVERVCSVSGASCTIDADCSTVGEVCIDWNACPVTSPPTDQRGIPRPQDGDGDGIAKCDIGAFEFVLSSDPVDLLTELVEQVASLGLAHGIENSLLAKLNTALLILGDLQRNNDHAAANVLGAFIRQIQAQHGKKIAAGDAEALIEAAEEIINLLSGDMRIRRSEFRRRLFSPGKRLGLGSGPQEPE